MALLTVTNFGRGGVLSSVGAATAAAVNDSWANTGNELVVVFNGTPSHVTISVHIPTLTAPNGFKPPDRTVFIPPGESIIFGPFPVEWYGTSPAIDYSISTGVIVHVIRPIEMTKI